MLETRVITKVEASGRRENWQKKTHAYFLTPFLPAAFTLLTQCTTEFQNSGFWNVIFAVLTLSISNVKEIWKHLCLHFYFSVIQSIKCMKLWQDATPMAAVKSSSKLPLLLFLLSLFVAQVNSPFNPCPRLPQWYNAIVP